MSELHSLQGRLPKNIRHSVSDRQIVLFHVSYGTLFLFLFHEFSNERFFDFAKTRVNTAEKRQMRYYRTKDLLRRLPDGTASPSTRDKGLGILERTTYSSLRTYSHFPQQCTKMGRASIS